MSRPTAQDYALVDAHLNPNRSLAAHTAWDVRDCGAKAVMALRSSLAAAEDKNATLIRDLELACRDLAAVKLSRDAAEAKLAEYESQARAQGDTILDLNAKLADEVRLADALLRELNRRQDASFSLTTDDVIADYEAARQAGKAVEREEGKR